jgi:hypothetical protein
VPPLPSPPRKGSRINTKHGWQQVRLEEEREHKSAGAWVNDIMVEAKDG